ncbi:hypothetical protein FJZ36_01215 [Candidatus Poribacteria bacterium]|nr:hypothetical protein [Candidatus Poribacteria bacterium]
MATSRQDARVVQVCRHLRTKSAFIPNEEGSRALVEPTETSQYWCNRSGGATGPDNGFAHPHECTGERSCYLAAPLLLTGTGT